MSDFIPNTFQTPNAVIDRLMELLTDGEFRVLMYTTRHVLGWQKKIKSKKAAISISNYVNGFSYTDSKGEKQSYSGCGLKDAAVRSALQSLEKYRVLKSEGVSEHGRTWELAFMTSDDVDFEGLEKRLEEKHGKNKAKISQARELNPLLAPPVQQNPSCSTEVPPSCATEPPPSCSTGDNETHIETNIETNIETHIADYAALPVVTGRIIKEKAANPYYDAIKDILGLHGGQNGDMQKMLMGISKKNGYKDYNLNPAMDVLEFIEWGKWAKKKLGQFMVKSPAKVNGYITEWREMGSPKADEPKPTKPTSSMTAARAMAILNQASYEDGKNGND